MIAIVSIFKILLSVEKVWEPVESSIVSPLPPVCASPSIVSLLPSPAAEIVKVSLPSSPLRVSVPAPLTIVYAVLPPAEVKSIVPPELTAVRVAVPAFVVPLSATKAVILVAFAIAPELTTKSSPVARSVTVSVPESTLNVSLPTPPEDYRYSLHL